MTRPYKNIHFPSLAALCVAVLLLLAPARSAYGLLKSEQVVIVVNSNEPYSVALGRFYAASRKVPEQNIVALDLPTTVDMSSEDYDNKLVKPLRKALADRELDKSVKCLLTIYGVPYLLAAGELPPELLKTWQWGKRAAVESLSYMQRNVRLLDSVGAAPPTATVNSSYSDLEELFGEMDELTVNTEETGAQLTGEFARKSREKVAQIRKMADGKARQIAVRQIIALYLDAYGLEGWNMLIGLLGDLAPPIPGTLAQQKQQLNETHKRLLDSGGLSDETLDEVGITLFKLRGRAGLFEFGLNTYTQIENRNNDSRAAVDSELALLFWDDYNREAARTNPLYWQSLPQLSMVERENGRVLMTCRLDGPSIEAIMKIVQMSIEAETAGLSGKVYLDYGGRELDKFNRQYDQLAESLKTFGAMDVVQERSVLLFSQGQCEQAAIYVGYFSPHYYVDAFDFVGGAIAYHIGNSEALMLRDKSDTGWVPNLIKSGAVVIVGDVYNGGFTTYPQGYEFIPMLLSGKMTIAECYWRSVTSVSWRMLLVGDPLYNPYKKNPVELPVPDTMLPR